MNHLRFNKTAINEVIKDPAVYITSVRDIYTHFQSIYNFYYGRFKNLDRANHRPCDFACLGAPMSEWSQNKTLFPRGLHNMTEFIEHLDQLDYQNTDWGFRFHNLQAFELGLNNELHDNPMHKLDMEEQVKQLTSELDLVLLVDQYEESLILLKHELCMNWIDLWSPTKRTQNYERRDLSELEKEILKSHNSYDNMIYEHFARIFNNSEKAAIVSPNINQELSDLKELLEYCNDSPVACHKMWDESHKVALAQKTEWQEPEFIPTSESNNYLEIVNYMIENKGNCKVGAEQEVINDPKHGKPFSCEAKKEYREIHMNDPVDKNFKKHDELAEDAQDFFEYDNGDLDENAVVNGGNEHGAMPEISTDEDEPAKFDPFGLPGSVSKMLNEQMKFEYDQEEGVDYNSYS